MRAGTDLTGQTVGRWTVLGPLVWRGGVRFWRCRCRCGTVREVRETGLLYGGTQSCGCYQRQRTSECNTARAAARAVHAPAVKIADVAPRIVWHDRQRARREAEIARRVARHEGRTT